MSTTHCGSTATNPDLYSRCLTIRKDPDDTRIRVTVSAAGSAVLAMAQHLAELRYGESPPVAELVRRAMECMVVWEREPPPAIPRMGKCPRQPSNHPAIRIAHAAVVELGFSGTGVSPADASPWVAALACHMSPGTLPLWPMDPRTMAIYCVPDPKQRPAPVSPNNIRWSLDRGIVLAMAERDLRENNPEPMPAVAAWWNQTGPIISRAADRAAGWFGW